MKYFEPKSNVTEEYVLRAFIAECAKRNLNPHDISFLSIKELVIDRDPNFASAKAQYIGRSEVRNFEHLKHLVRDSINQGVPHIISLPVQFPDPPLTRWHIVTVVGYDDFNFRVYDPNPYRTSPYDLQLPRLLSDLQALAQSEITDSLVIRVRV